MPTSHEIRERLDAIAAEAGRLRERLEVLDGAARDLAGAELAELARALVERLVLLGDRSPMLSLGHVDPAVFDRLKAAFGATSHRRVYGPQFAGGTEPTAIESCTARHAGGYISFQCGRPLTDEERTELERKAAGAQAVAEVAR